MRVPEIDVQTHEGACVALRDLAAERPLALVFLRHFGCLFCREQVARLRDGLADENVVFVCMATPERAARFRKWMRSPHTFISDPGLKLYGLFGIRKGSFRQVLGPQVSVRAFQTLGRGYFPGRFVGDPWQLGGTVIIDQAGNVALTFPAGDAGDHPSPEAIRSALAQAAAA